jgi:hypothetical protein
MPSLIPDFATVERSLAGLPVVKHRALTAGSKTGGLLFLKSGTVEVGQLEPLPGVSDPGAVHL